MKKCETKNFFWLPHIPCGISVPQPGIEPTASAVEAQSFNHWANKGSPEKFSVSDLVYIWIEQGQMGWTEPICNMEVNCMQTGMDPVQLKRQEIPHKLSDQLCPVRAVVCQTHLDYPTIFVIVEGMQRHVTASYTIWGHQGQSLPVLACSPLWACVICLHHMLFRDLCVNFRGKHPTVWKKWKIFSPFSFFLFFPCLLPFALLEKQSVLENYQEFMQRRTVKSTNQP